MKSGKQKRRELKAKRKAKREAVFRRARIALLAKHVAVDRSQLSLNGGYGQPDYVRRGYYVDIEFECQKCGKPQIWTEEQQKWWYEIAKGGVRTTATHCRLCRQAERARREEARRLHLEGLARKQREES
jgi:hypothetical protein